MDKGRPPVRLRHSWEARCRLVGLVLSGCQSAGGCWACGMSRATAYRLLRRYQQGGGRACGIARRSPSIVRIGSSPEAEAADRRAAAPDRVGAALVVSGAWAGRPRRSGGCLYGMAARAPSSSPGRQPIGMSTPRSASWCTWTSRSWAASGRSENASSKTATARSRAPAGHTPTSRSTTTPATPRRAAPLRNRPATAPPSPKPVITAYAARAHRSSGSSPTTAPATAATPSATCSHQHGIRHIRTKPYTPTDKRQSRSLHPHPATRMGLRLHLPHQHTPRHKHSPASYAGTTTTDHTAASAATHHISRVSHAARSYS